jgi:hypothetical protein
LTADATAFNPAVPPAIIFMADGDAEISLSAGASPVSTGGSSQGVKLHGGIVK